MWSLCLQKRADFRLNQTEVQSRHAVISITWLRFYRAWPTNPILLRGNCFPLSRLWECELRKQRLSFPESSPTFTCVKLTGSVVKLLFRWEESHLSNLGNQHLNQTAAQRIFPNDFLLLLFRLKFEKIERFFFSRVLCVTRIYVQFCSGFLLFWSWLDLNL